MKNQKTFRHGESKSKTNVEYFKDGDEKTKKTLKYKMQGVFASLHKKRGMIAAIAGFVVVAGIATTAIIVLNSGTDEPDEQLVSEPEIDPVRAAIARRKAELAEMISTITTPESAAPIIEELESLLA